jgi:hypothetical protein
MAEDNYAEMGSEYSSPYQSKNDKVKISEPLSL